MNSEKVKHIFLFSLGEYFKELLQGVDRINSASKSRDSIVELYSALAHAADRELPIVVPRGQAVDKRLANSGTDFYYRMVKLAEGGADELVAMLAIDIAELPKSVIASIEACVKHAPEPLVAARLLCFVLTKDQKASAFQRVMLIAARTAAGSLVAFPFPVEWKVGDQVIGDSLRGLDPSAEDDRLNYLLHLVIDQDGASIHEAGQKPGDSVH